jgi:ADP-heptose:LPS heptosyltransferase
LTERFAAEFGVVASNSFKEFHFRRHEVQKINSLIRNLSFDGRPLVVLHGGPSWSVKELPTESWTEVVRLLEEYMPVRVIQVGFDKSISAGNTSSMHIPGTLDLFNKLSLVELALLLLNISVFVGIDSGPLHVARALNVRTVSIFGPTLPDIVLAPARNSTVIVSDLRCSGCHHDRNGPLHWISGCPNNIACMKLISPKTLFENVAEHLRQISSSRVPTVDADQEPRHNGDQCSGAQA